MDQIGFQGGSPGASDHKEAVQGVVKLDCYREAAIQDPYHGITEDLNQPDAAEVAAPLWDQDDGLSGAILRKVTLKKIRLDQVNNHLQF